MKNNSNRNGNSNSKQDLTLESQDNKFGLPDYVTTSAP